MPNRILREGILASEAVCSLSWGAEVFYRRLMSVADDHGRYYAAPKLLRAHCYPQQIDKVTDADLGKWIAECEQAGLVSVYPALDGKRYLQIAKFGQQIRSKSKFPDPVGDQPLALASNCEQTPANAHLGVFVSEGVSVSDKPPIGGSGAAPSAAPPTPPPPFDGKNFEILNGKSVVAIAVGFDLPEAWGIDAESLGWKPGEVLRESEKFRQYWTAGKGQGTRRSVKGWRQAWSNWLEKAARDKR